MTYTLHFLPEVEEDVIAGYAWYEEKAPGLSEEFLRMFYACAGEISQNPLLYPKVYGEYRRSLLRGFPYAIYYYSDRLYLTLVRNFAMFNAWILQLYFPVSKSTWGPYARFFRRLEGREFARCYVTGLMMEGEGKSVEPMSERVNASERGMQRLLTEVKWDREGASQEYRR